MFFCILLFFSTFRKSLFLKRPSKPRKHGLKPFEYKSNRIYHFPIWHGLKRKINGLETKTKKEADFSASS